MKIGMLFPGYGSQSVGMGKELYDDSRIMQEYFEEAANCLPINFVKLCFASSDTEISYMNHAYPALFLVSLSIYSILKEAGIKPDFVAGYDTGVYAALFAAEGLSLPDGLYLLNKYALFYQEMLDASPAKFIGVRLIGCPTEDIEVLVREATTRNSYARIGIYESPRQHIVTGHEEAVSEISECILESRECKSHDLGIERGLHSSFMDPVGDQLKPYLEKVDFKDLAMPLYTSNDVVPISDAQSVKDHVLRYMSAPILMTGIIEHMVETVDLIVEVGPGSFLTDLIKERYPDKPCISINKPEDIETLKTMVLQNEPIKNDETEHR
jgi:[acyl-carrier-protein] S-malonyltransferase